MTITEVLQENESSSVSNITQDSRDLDYGLSVEEKKEN